MPKFYQTKEFRELEKTWDGKLKDSGFTDIEKAVRDDRILIQHASNVYRQAPEVERDAKLKYHQLLSQLTQEETFTSDVDKLIMERRAAGVSIKDTVAELKALNQSRSQETVRFTIRKYEHKWNIRQWKPTQMTATRPNKKKKLLPPKAAIQS